MTLSDIDPGISGEQVTAEQQQLLMSSPDARAQRQLNARAALPYPSEPLRGKRRGLDFANTDEILPIDPVEVRNLGIHLSAMDVPVLDDLNRYYSPDPKPEAIERYIMYAGANNERRKRERDEAQLTLEGIGQVVLTDEQKRQKKMAQQRKPQAVADSLQRALHANLAAANVRHAAITAVTEQMKTGQPYNESAARYAADAIEDLGACLADPENLDMLLGACNRDLAFRIAHFGYKAGEQTEILADQPLVLLLARREQERRQVWWSDRLNAMLRIDRNRRTTQDRENAQATQELIASFAEAGVAS